MALVGSYIVECDKRPELLRLGHAIYLLNVLHSQYNSDHPGAETTFVVVWPDASVNGHGVIATRITAHPLFISHVPADCLFFAAETGQGILLTLDEESLYLLRLRAGGGLRGHS